jgi:hypothetical protein
MPGICIHEFFWPLRAADGRYYQVCRSCGVQCEYDWMTMERVGGVPGVTLAPGVSGPNPSTRPETQPQLKLLVELEPAYRVFLRNLVDVLRPASPGEPTIWSALFWREAFFDSGIPWQRFAETLVGQLVVVAMLLLVSQVWITQDQPRRRSMFENTHLTYYKPEGSFPSLRSSPPRVRPVSGKPAESARRGSIHVTPERTQGDVKAPDLKLKGPGRPNIVASNAVPPVMPLASSGAPSRLAPTPGLTPIIAPLPEVSQGTSRQMGLLQASGVAPAPEPGMVSSNRLVTVSNTAVVAPPPLVQALVRRVGDINIGATAVVAPAPRLPMGEQHPISGARQSTTGSLVAWAVPPPPTAPRSETLSGGREGLLSGVGSNVVPPPPSVQNVVSSAAGGHIGSLASSGNSWSSAGVQVVPPPPSLQGSGNSGAGQRSTSLASGRVGNGLQAVPPAPSLQGSGNSRTGQRSSSLASGGIGNGLQAVPPAPSVGAAGAGAGGNSDHGGRQMAMNSDPALPPPPSPATESPRQQAEAARAPATEEMPLRLIGLAMALPNSTYFSNYEVYIAERRLRKNLTELVKLVYVYLPYQRRLSDYGVDDSKVYKLLVSRDRSCDESLMQMTWPEADPHPDMHSAADAPGLSAQDKKGMLPCYRTTADDYRKAISRR